MLSKVSEKTMHSVRWVLVIGWLILIASLFYDPISQYLTDKNNLISPFRDVNECVLVQGKCLDVKASYSMGTRIFWGMVIPSAIMIVLVFGHETWRRICPLYFLSQIPRALNLQSKLNIETIDKTTGGEKSDCINCKSPCLDIDAERTYWDSLTQPSRKLIQYGYLGLVTSYFIYYFLYSGNFDYYYSGVWTHETNQLASLFTPGFYIRDRAIPIPKIIAAPVTLAFGVVISYVICRKLEKTYGSSVLSMLN